ncbi:uncharacterized protein LOC110096381 [Dendrobium catenatum]|uniref:uncharacterized protein LOC110096381 n=1 Tax=Dendrobium catenatum TaxID=906689 RepID=UPI00109FE2A9|nr:uncharacterized protein LOC110096381 [Dendrobium catenatum]
MAFLRLPLILRLRQTLSPLNRHSIGSVSCFSSGSGSIEINISDEESRRRLHNRLLYRSRQRGFLELDLILGKWVEENIRSLDEAKIRSLVDVLNLVIRSLVLYWTFYDIIELIFILLPSKIKTCRGDCGWFPIVGMALIAIPWIYWILTCLYRTIMPFYKSPLTENGGFSGGVAVWYCGLRKFGLGAEPGQPWVRGWDDKRGLEGGPKHGNQ